MKFNKLFLFVTMMAAGMAFTSCDNKDEYVPGLPAGEHNVGFESEENQVIGMTQETIEVELTRANTEGYLAVPLEALIVPECMTLPDSARFEDGSATATIEVLVDSTMKTFTDYQLSFRVPEAYTNAYAEDGKNPVFNITVKKEDFKLVANSVFIDQVFFKTQWEQAIEYSPMLGIYRLADCFSAGTHWYFHFNGSDEFWFTESDGTKTEKFGTGYVHATYGMIMANVNSSYPMGYDTEVEGLEGEFYFVMKFTVSAGSFGENYEMIDVLEWIEKPWEAEVAE